MIHVISIKKKYFYFFLISILISAIITFASYAVIKNNDNARINEKCSKYISYKIENKYNSTVLFNYISVVAAEQIKKLKKIKNNVTFQKNEIYFSGDCEKQISDIIEKLNIIEKSMQAKLYDLMKKIKESGSPLPLSDQVMVFNLDESFIEIEKRILDVSPKLLTKMFIQFLIIIILLNGLYYLKNKIKFNFK